MIKEFSHQLNLQRDLYQYVKENFSSRQSGPPSASLTDDGVIFPGCVCVCVYVWGGGGVRAPSRPSGFAHASSLQKQSCVDWLYK